LDDDNIKNMDKILVELKPKILPQKLAKLFNSQLDIDNFNDDEVYALTKYFYLFSKNPNKNMINPEKFFNSNEIRTYDAMEDIDYSVELDNKIIFHNVVEIKEGIEWRSAKVSAKDLKSFMDRNLITYNPRTQRPSDKRLINGKVREIISTNKKSIKQIAQLIIDENYYVPTITFNILNNGDEKITYKDGTLGITVENGCEVDLIDGFHNISSICKALQIKPEIDLDFKVDIFRISEAEARSFISMRNRQNLFSVTSESYYDTSNVYNLLANDINSASINNQMKNKLGKDYQDVKLLNKLTTFKVISTAIRDNFELENTNVKKTRDVKLYLIEFFNEILGSIFSEEFSDVKASRATNSLVTTNNTFYGYIALASALYTPEWEQNNWQDKLSIILKSIDFNRDSKIWLGKGMTLKDIVGKQKNQMYEYFKSLAKVSKINTKKESVL